MSTTTATSAAVAIASGSVALHHLSASRSGPDPQQVFDGFPPPRTTVLSQFVFGGRRFRAAAELRKGGAQWPVTWVQGNGADAEDVIGMQAIALSGAPVQRVELDGRVVGATYVDADAEWCYLGGVLPADPGRSRAEQARSVFERLEAALGQVGMDFSHVARTWLYLDRLLEWYGEFNVVRNEFFQQRRVYEHLVPASTGIGAANPDGAALVAGLVALKPRQPSVRVLPVISPLQCPPTNYRSAFSRAVEIQRSGRRQLLISGTASIDPSGASVHRDDVDGQIELTMAVVEAILESRQMRWADTTRMTAYFTDLADGPRFTAWCRAHGLPGLPVVFSHAVICREELLFEIELDAWSQSAGPE